MVAFSLCVEWLNGRPAETVFTDEKFVKLAVDRVLCQNVSSEDYYLIHQGRLVNSDDEISEREVYHAIPRIVGGKGGFGSMLRALGAQIEKTTNREACRDLSGRRMRDVNNEKKLREWAAKAGEREKEKQERRREKREKMLAPKKFREEDKEYEQQRQQIADDLDDAFEQGLKKVAVSSASVSLSSASSATCSSSTFVSSTSRKRKSVPAATEVDPKKAKPWLHMGDDASSSDESVKDEHSALSDEQNNESHIPSTSKAISCETTDAKLEQTDAQAQAKLAEVSAATPDYMQLGQTLDLSQFSSAEELCSQGLEVLKAALMARGMKCGGSVKERAERLFAVKGMDIDQIPSSLLAKPIKKK